MVWFYVVLLYRLVETDWESNRFDDMLSSLRFILTTVFFKRIQSSFAEKIINSKRKKNLKARNGEIDKK